MSCSTAMLALEVGDICPRKLPFGGNGIAWSGLSCTGIQTGFRADAGEAFRASLLCGVGRHQSYWPEPVAALQ